MAAAAIAVTTLFVAVPQPASAATPPSGQQRIFSDFFWGRTATLRCLVSRQASSADHVSLISCGASQDQLWEFRQDATDPHYFHIYSVDKKNCLIARNFGAEPNVAVLGACGHYSDQEWFFHWRDQANGIFILQRLLDSQCLTEPEIIYSDWVHVTVGSCATENAQWQLL